MSRSKQLVGLLILFVLVPIFGAGAEVHPLTLFLICILAARLSADDTTDHFGRDLHIHPFHGHDIANSLVTRHLVIGAILGISPSVSIVGE